MEILSNEYTYKIAFVLLWVAYVAIRVPFDKKYQQIEKVKRFRTPNEKLVFILLGLGLMLLPMLWVLTPLLNYFHIEFTATFRLAGVVMAILSLFYFRWIHSTLASNWSPTLEIMKEQKLITHGPYKYIRHPMYLQMLFWVIAQFFISANSLVGIVGILSWIALSILRIPREEKMLKEHFGERYLEYMKHSGRIFPFFR